MSMLSLPKFHVWHFIVQHCYNESHVLDEKKGLGLSCSLKTSRQCEDEDDKHEVRMANLYSDFALGSFLCYNKERCREGASTRLH